MHWLTNGGRPNGLVLRCRASTRARPSAARPRASRMKPRPSLSPQACSAAPHTHNALSLPPGLDVAPPNGADWARGWRRAARGRGGAS